MQPPKPCDQCKYCELGWFQYSDESGSEQEWYCVTQDAHRKYETRCKWGKTDCPNYEVKDDLPDV
jgi:hypothetical protein